jgi:hypothetical protein
MSENEHSPIPSTAHLPEVIRRHLERALPAGLSGKQVRITQRGEMWLKPGRRATRFEATQSFDPERVGFCWRARFRLLGPLNLQVVDDYADGDGKLEVRLFRLPLQRQRGTETVKGEALRYLAELPFAPSAMLLNDQLEWRSLDERSTEVATTVAGERLSVRLEANEAGDIVHSSSEMRCFKVGREWVPRPWGGVFDDYETLGGMRIPTTGEAYWELPEGRYVYWRGTVESAELLDRPFRRDES